MSALLLVGYGGVAVAVLCAGAFGIGIGHRENGGGWVFRYGLVTLICAVIWPVAIPLYFAFKKGAFYGPQGAATKAKGKQVYVSRGVCACRHNWSSHDAPSKRYPGGGGCNCAGSRAGYNCACNFYAPSNAAADVLT